MTRNPGESPYYICYRFICNSWIPQNHGEGRGRPLNKLQTIKKGPMKVVGFEKDAYDFLNLVTRTVDTVHVSRIYPFLYDPEVIDPENVAIRDQG